MSHSKYAHPRAFERANYMKVLSAYLGARRECNSEQTGTQFPG